jgi:hypothetical protein
MVIPEQALFALRGIWASPREAACPEQAKRAEPGRFFCDAIIARLARFLIKPSHPPLTPLSSII